MTEPIDIKPGDRVIIVDSDNTVLYSDFEPSTAPNGNQKPHLLDFIDMKHQDILRIVGVALDRPGKWVETVTTFRGERLRIRATHFEALRTDIVFSTKNLD